MSLKINEIIFKFGPGVVAVHADEAFLSINAGRYKNDTCPKDDPNHAMVSKLNSCMTTTLMIF